MRQKKQRAQSPLRTMDDLNLTPMMDLVFLLLIVFMITAPLLENAIDVTPPTQNASELNEENTTVVSVSQDGIIYIDKTPIDEAVLIERLRQLKADNPSLNVALRADGKQMYEKVIHVLGLIKKAGIENVPLLTLEE